MKHGLQTISLLALIFSSPLYAAEGLVQASLHAETSTVVAGRPFRVGVLFKISPGWHIYWMNAGDTGIPTQITFDLPPGFSAGAVEFPTPHRFEMTGDLISFGYADEVMLLTTITPPADLPAGQDVTLRAKASWLVCQENCIKGDAPVELKLKTAADTTPVDAVLFSRWETSLPKQGGKVAQQLKIEAPAGQFKSAVGTLVLSETAPVEKVEWFPAAPDALQVTENTVRMEGGKAIVSFKLNILAGEKISGESFPSVLAYSVKGTRVGVSVPISLSADLSK